MSLATQQIESLVKRGFTRRQMGRIGALLSAGAALPFYNEFAMAQDAAQQQRPGRGAGGGMRRAIDPDAVVINQNENPMGPCKEGLEAIAAVAPRGWRYNPGNESSDFRNAAAEQLGIKPEYILSTAGSSDPLHAATCAFTSPTRSWVMANPGYGGGAPAFIGSKVVRVPLADDYSHDVRAMLKADPDAGAYYICNPNNPTATLTSRKDIEFLLANKNKDAVVVVDEAYIHFTEKAVSAADLVAADKDVVVLRTFSKIYGMAGLRAGFAAARPELLQRLRAFSSSSFLPVTGVACAAASMKVKNLVAERRGQMVQVRNSVFAYFEKKGISFVPSEGNFFMMEAKRPHAEFAQAMAEQKVIVGRQWPIWPTKVRVTVGTQEEMNKFMAAVDKVWA
jgi:histidinol-phosphate aminotransferase